MNLGMRQGPALHPMPGETRLNDAFLVAATINALGCIDLPSVRNGKREGDVRVEFSLGTSGDFLQRCYGSNRSDNGIAVTRIGTYRKEPMDMVYLAECLTHTLGALTPDLFKLSAQPLKGAPQLLLPGAHNDRKRLLLLHEAFNIYLLAYEDYRA